MLFGRTTTIGITKCKSIIFIGSVGSLVSDIGIGDIVIPEYSICGDGASRYLASDDLTKDVFGDATYPDPILFNRTKKEIIRICEKSNVKWHIGKTFSIDTIFAQFAHIDTILNMDATR